MIAIVDYGVGNLYSLEQSFKAIDAQVIVTGKPEELQKAEKILLPGVGAFGDAVEKLRNTGMADAVLEQVAAGKPLMGICLGMQLLFDHGLEYGEHAGLGLISGEVRPISEVIPKELKIPHMGWNALEFTRESRLFQHIKNGDYVYFVHSSDGGFLSFFGRGKRFEIMFSQKELCCPPHGVNIQFPGNL